MHRLGLAVDVTLVALNVLGIAGLVYVDAGPARELEAMFREPFALPIVTNWMLTDHGAIWLAGLFSGVALGAVAIRWRWSAVVARLVGSFNVALLSMAVVLACAAMCGPFIANLCLGCKRCREDLEQLPHPPPRVCGSFLPRCAADAATPSRRAAPDGS